MIELAQAVLLHGLTIWLALVPLSIVLCSRIAHSHINAVGWRELLLNLGNAIAVFIMNNVGAIVLLKTAVRA